MHDEMVERVAKAISVAIDDTSQSYCEMVARAAIAAMREPTDRMCNAGAAKWDDDWCSETNALNMWQAMIDHALSYPAVTEPKENLDLQGENE